jgi:hypothetical protein
VKSVTAIRYQKIREIEPTFDSWFAVPDYWI